MKKQELIILNTNEIDLYDLEEKEIIELANNIINNLEISKLRDYIKKACLNLTGVNAPCFGADAVVIALDNQERLEITYKLLNGLDMVETYLKNLRKNKYKCRDNYEYIFNFLLCTKNIFGSIVEYGDFKRKEKEDNIKQLEEYKQNLLEKGII